MSTRPIVILAGGTGGHVYPGLAVADELRQRGDAVIWLGSEHSFESRVVPERGYVFHGLRVLGARGKGALAKVRAAGMVVRAIFGARSILKRNNVRAAMSFGGFAAGPGGIAAALLGIPLFVHEQNRIPGLTNKILARFAKSVLCGFPDSFAAHPRQRYVGNPVRATIAALAGPTERLQNRTGRTRILVIGGSQGAQALNERLPQALAKISPEERPEIWHQTGPKLFDAAIADYQSAAVEGRVVAFIEDMAAAYAWADVVICRAGASTIAELCAVGVGALFVPFPLAVDDHQTKNALWLVEQDAAMLCAQKDLSVDRLVNLIGQLSSRERCLRMAVNAKKAAKLDATQRCADLLGGVS